MRVIGLISGTSVDGIDAALIDIAGTDWDLRVEFVAGAIYPYPGGLREQILAVCGEAAVSMAKLAELDDAIALAFAEAAQNIQIGHTPAQLIGSHGQTIYHRPPIVRGTEVATQPQLFPLHLYVHGYLCNLLRSCLNPDQ